MASVKDDFIRGVNPPRENQPTFLAAAGGTILPHRLVKPASSGAIVKVSQVSGLGDPVVGANGEYPRKAGDPVTVKYGRVSVVAGAPVVAGDMLVTDAEGRVVGIASAGTEGAELKSAVAGLAFTNQPTKDAIEILSASASDTTQKVTIIGTTYGEATVVSETVTLNGTSAVETTKQDWGVILCVSKDAATAGTVTVRKKTGAGTITAGLTASVLSLGITPVSPSYAYLTKPTAVASGTTTKVLGIEYTDASGSKAYQAVALTNTTAVTFGAVAREVTAILTGDVETTRTVTVSVGSAANAENSYKLSPIGIALTAGAAGDLVDVLLIRPA